MQGFGTRDEESIFQELDTVIGALRGNGDVDGALKRGMSSVDQTLNLMSEQRSILGEQMHMIDARERLLSSGELSASQRRSDLMDTDYAEVLSGIQSRDMALRAAMQEKKAQQDLVKLRDEFSNLAFDTPDKLQPAADKIGVPLQKHTEWLTRTNADSLKIPKAVVDALFSDEVFHKI